MVILILTPGKSQALHSWLLACHTFLRLQLPRVFSERTDKQVQVAALFVRETALLSKTQSRINNSISFGKCQSLRTEISKYFLTII